MSVEWGFTVLHTLPLVVNAAWIHKQLLCCFQSSECYRWTRRTQAQARNSCCCIVPGRLVVSCLHSENKVMIRIKLNFVKHLRMRISEKRCNTTFWCRHDIIIIRLNFCQFLFFLSGQRSARKMYICASVFLLTCHLILFNADVNRLPGSASLHGYSRQQVL